MSAHHVLIKFTGDISVCDGTLLSALAEQGAKEVGLQYLLP